MASPSEGLWVHLSGAGPLAVSYLGEQDACLQEVLIASFLAVLVAYWMEGVPFVEVVVPCAWLVAEAVRRLS